MTKLELATKVVEQMDHQELYESAITGLVRFYELNAEKFQEDLEREKE